MKVYESSLMPKLYEVRQNMNLDYIAEPEGIIAKQMLAYTDRIKKGGTIGIAAGSRGIFNYSRIIKAVVDSVKEAGAIPVIIPAMGSHGGANAQGQAELIAGYGITEENMGAEIRSSMEVVKLGETSNGVPVYYDLNAYGLDGMIMVNRIKPHTDFTSSIESGLMKQMAVGLGKHKGAAAMHSRGVSGLINDIPEAARMIMEKTNILLGVAIIENAADKTVQLEVIPKEKIEEREKELLIKARSLMPKLPCTDIDALIIQEMGKNISGTGIDPNIVGRSMIRGLPDPEFPSIYRIVVLSLTKASHGNALGMGIADVITRRMYEQIDFRPTYVNVVTTGFLERGFTPFVAECDSDAIEIALKGAKDLVTKENARVVFCKNTLDLSRLLVSETVWNEIKSLSHVELVGEYCLDFDDEGYLKKNIFD